MSENTKGPENIILLKELEQTGISDLYSLLEGEGVTETNLWALSQEDLAIHRLAMHRQSIGPNLIQRKRYLQAKQESLDGIEKIGNLSISISS